LLLRKAKFNLKSWITLVRQIHDKFRGNDKSKLFLLLCRQQIVFLHVGRHTSGITIAV